MNVVKAAAILVLTMISAISFANEPYSCNSNGMHVTKQVAASSPCNLSDAQLDELGIDDMEDEVVATQAYDDDLGDDLEEDPVS